MSFDYGISTLLKLKGGNFGQARHSPNTPYPLNQPAGLRICINFEASDLFPRGFGPVNEHPANFNWNISLESLIDFMTLRLQYKSWLELEGFEIIKHFFQEEWSTPMTFNRQGKIHELTHSLPDDLGTRRITCFCVEVRPVIEQLSREDEKSVFLGNLVDAFKNEKCANVVVKAGDQTFKVSEFMLRTQSDVFNAMFTHQTEEQQTKVIEIKNAEPEVVASMLEYVHTGKFEGSNSVAAQLLPLADQYQLKELCKMCGEKVCSNLTVFSVIEKLKFVALYDHLTDFKKRVFDFTCENLDRICKLPAWKEFGEKNVHIVMEILDASAQFKKFNVPSNPIPRGDEYYDRY